MFALLVKIDLDLEPNLQDFIILLGDMLLAWQQLEDRFFFSLN